MGALAGICGFKYRGVEKLLKGAVMIVHGDVGTVGLRSSAREGGERDRKGCVVAPKLIHTDQAGFMSKRSIYDQTKIVELMLKWSENTTMSYWGATVRQQVDLRDSSHRCWLASHGSRCHTA